MAVTATIRDDFKDNSLSAGIWTLPAWGGAPIAENNNQLEITSTLASGYYGIDTPLSHNLTGSYAFGKSNGATNETLASFEMYPIIVNADNTGNNQMFWLLSPQPGTVRAFKKVAGVSTQVGSTLSYSTYGRGYFRVRENGSGITYWDYSDAQGRGLSWINLWSEANPLTITTVKLGFMQGTFAAEAATSVAQFGGLNFVTRKIR